MLSDDELRATTPPELRGGLRFWWDCLWIGTVSMIVWAIIAVAVLAPYAL